MESVPLERAPRVAVYTPPNSSPWDDAVTLALEYAEIPYETVWDAEVLVGRLSDFDWLHLHHEDFTGQYSKFYLTYAGTEWLQEEVERNEGVAAEFGYASVPELKKAVARAIRTYVEGGGFLFAMCTATETLDLALAARTTDIAASSLTGRQWTRRPTGRWTGARPWLSPTPPSSRSPRERVQRHRWAPGQHAAATPLSSFTLFDFSAKFDPVPTMLTQSHVRVLPDFYGLTTSFRRTRLKPGMIVLAEGGSGIAKYIHGVYGEGTFTFYWWTRSRGSAAPDRRSPDRSGAPAAFTGVSSDPEQRAVSGRQEEGVENVIRDRVPAVDKLCQKGSSLPSIDPTL